MTIGGNKMKQNNQYTKFETMFASERREDVVDILNNLPKDTIIGVLDAYDETVQELYPEIISIKECIEIAVANGTIQPSTDNINNLYRELAGVVIGRVEDELHDILPDIDTDDPSINESESTKIHGEIYDKLEDNLTELFKVYKF